MSLAWKTDDEFGVAGAIANFDHPRILTIPKTEVVLPFLNEHLCVDMGFVGRYPAPFLFRPGVRSASI
jgi:hypothetical protein